MSTLLQANHGGPIQVLQLSDFHLLNDPAETMMGINTEESFTSVLRAACSHHGPADLALLTGDLAQEATPATYGRLKEYLRDLHAPAFCLPGNHDEAELMQAELEGGAITVDSQILIGNWQIICLDSTVVDSPCGYLRADQMQKLQMALTEQPRTFTLICLHHSPLPTRSQWLDTMRLGNADEFLGLLELHPQAKGVVFGHVHQVMDEWRGSLRLMACPSTCFQFKPGSGDFALDPIPPGYRWLHLHPDGRLETGVERLSRMPQGLDLASEGY